MYFNHFLLSPNVISNNAQYYKIIIKHPNNYKTHLIIELI